MPDPTRDSRPHRTESRDWSEHLRPRLASLALTPAREREITDELSQHLDDRQDDQLRRSLLQLTVQHPAIHRCHSHICYSQYVRVPKRLTGG